MKNKPKIIATITESFDLKNHGRSDGNNRKYIIDTVKAMIENARFKERLKLGELFGYFGHGRRELTGKMDIGEIEVIMKDGKPIVLENVPSNRLVAISVTDEGIVTHTQEIFGTPSGIAVKAMYDSGVGGWSWAVRGVESMRGAIARSLHGFDFVKNPSYIDTEKQSMMLESCGAESVDLMIENMLESAGFDAGQAGKLDEIWARNSDVSDQCNELDCQVMLLEGVLAEKQARIDELEANATSRHNVITEAVKGSSVILSEAQVRALIDGNSTDDGKYLSAMFESMGSSSILPLDASDASKAHVTVVKENSPFADNMEGAIFMDSSALWPY